MANNIVYMTAGASYVDIHDNEVVNLTVADGTVTFDTPSAPPAGTGTARPPARTAGTTASRRPATENPAGTPSSHHPATENPAGTTREQEPTAGTHFPHHVNWPEVEEMLKGFFTPAFLGIGGAHVNQMDKLMADIRTLATSRRDLAMLALLMYRSPSFRRRHRTFSQWYRAFCSIVGCPAVSNCRPARLQPSEQMLRSFRYLL